MTNIKSIILLVSASLIVIGLYSVNAFAVTDDGILVYSSWYKDGKQYKPIQIYVNTDVHESCWGRYDGCVRDGKIIIHSLSAYSERGCTILTHYYLHLVGYSDDDIGYCEDNKVRSYE